VSVQAQELSQLIGQTTRLVLRWLPIAMPITAAMSLTILAVWQ
jgi:hypothetical protein